MPKPPNEIPVYGVFDISPTMFAVCERAKDSVALDVLFTFRSKERALACCALLEEEEKEPNALTMEDITELWGA